MFLSATVWGLRHLSNHRLLCSSKGHKPTALRYHLINGSFPGNAKFPGSEGLGSCRFQIQTIRVRRSIVHLRTVQFPGIPRAWGLREGKARISFRAQCKDLGVAAYWVRHAHTGVCTAHTGACGWG